MYDIIIVGAGGFGREVYQWSLDTFDRDKYNIKGFLSKNKNDLDSFNINCSVIGHEEDYNIQENDRFVIAIGDIEIKKRVVKTLKDKGAVFLTLIHPTAIISQNVSIGNGVVVCPYAVVGDSAKIGNFVMLNVYVYCGHDSVVGDYSILCPYSTLNGAAVLEEEVFIATHSIVTIAKKVGKHSIVGANSLVLHDVPCNEKVINVSKRPVF